MPVINPADLRGRPISRNWRFYVYQPAILWIGEIGGAPAQGDRELEVTTLIGNPADVLADMTVRVYTAAGVARDPGKVRFKSHTPGVPDILEVAENAVEWANGDLVQAWRLFEIWPRIPYIDGAGTQFKDRDIAWANDNQAQPPKANAGPAAIADLGGGGTVDVVFQDEGSFDCPAGAAIGTWLWAPIGGAPAVVAGGLNMNTVTLRYSTAGYYYVRLTVTDGNGITGHTYVPVIIDDGTYHRRNVLAVDRAWDSYGWRISRRIVGLATTAYDNTWYDGAPCFLVADAGGVASEAFADNRDNLRWSGWLVEDDTQRHEYGRQISFKAVSSAHILSNIPAFPTGLRSDAAPADWYEFTQLNVDSVAYLLLNWHSTACQVADYHPTGEWVTRLRPGENCDADDLLSQVNAVIGACKGDLRCDRQGILRAMRHEWFLSAAEEAARATVMTLADQDFQQANYGPHSHQAQFRETRLSGVTGAGTPYLAGAPGPSPLDGGKPIEVQRLAPLDQAELTRWAGQELAWRNNPGLVTLRMSGEYDAVDPALGEYVDGTLSTFDTRVPDGPYAVVGVRFADDHLKGVTLGEWQLLPDPEAYPAEARDIPVEPDPPDPDPLPDDGYPDLTPPLGTGEVVGMAGVGGFFYTSEAFDASPTWTMFTTGINAAGGDDSFIPSLCADPLQPTYAALIDNVGDVYITSDWRGGTNWSRALVADANDGGVSGTDARARVATAIGETYANVTSVELTTVESFAEPADETGTLLVVCQYQVPGGAGVRDKTRMIRSTDWGTTWAVGGIIFGYDFVGTVYESIENGKHDTAGAGVEGRGSLAHDGTYLFIVGRSMRENALGVSCLQYSSDWGATWQAAAVEGSQGTGPMKGMCDSTGKLWLARWQKAAGPEIATTADQGGTIIQVKALAAADGFAIVRGMLAILEDDAWLMLQIDEPSGGPTEDTEIYINGALQNTIGRPLRVAHGFSLDADVIYLGRSYRASEDAEASYQQVIYISQDKAVSFSDATGNLYTLGMRGVTGIISDWSSD